MAIVRAVKSGNWSDTTVWSTGALPTAADDVYSNTFTVTIDVSPTVLSISNAAATGVTAGGTFVPTNGITLTCTGAGVVGAVVNIGCLASSLITGQLCTVIGNLTVPANGYAATNLSSGTLNIVGNIQGGANGAAYGLLNNATGTVNVTGIVTGGGPAAAGSNQHGIANASTGTINITGSVFGGTGTNAAGVSQIAGAGTINVTGNITGSNGPGISSTQASSILTTGSITASNSAAGLSSSSATATVNLTGPFITSANGTNPVYALNWKWATTAPATYYQVRSANTLVIRPLYTADSVGGNPATSNVRSGTVYGPNNELTGTCAVPPAGSVTLGVPVDNTTGTAYITANDIATALSSASAVTLNQQASSLTTPGSIGERFKNAATVATVAQQLSDALSD